MWYTRNKNVRYDNPSSQEAQFWRTDSKFNLVITIRGVYQVLWECSRRECEVEIRWGRLDKELTFAKAVKD